MRQPKSGGGWNAIGYTLRLANRVGWWKLWKAMRTRNTCKTCALGMGGQLGGMVNEAGYFPEVCKKSFQAMVSDMQAGITPEFFAKFGFNELRALSPRQLESSGRLVSPLFAGPNDTGYQVISWDTALERLADRLKAAGPTHSFFYASGRSSNEAGFLLQLLARMFGTNYVNNCSYYCHQASSVGLSSSIGTGTGTMRLEDLDHTDLYFLIGGNPASNHPRLMRSLAQLRRRGGKVIIINPAKELGLVNFRIPSNVRSLLFGTEIASLYVQPHIGGDIALLAGIAKEILARGAQDEPFITQNTDGFDDFARRIHETPWTVIEGNSGVTVDEIRRIADLYLAAKRVVFGWTMGITHHLHGSNNVRMIANVALLRGMVGRAHAGLMPIRGHSNVQGLGSVGVTPTLKQAILERFERRLGIAVPKSPGLDTMACMEAADRNEMHSAICLGGNLYGSNPDAAFAQRALSRIGCIAYLATTLNTGHVWGRGRETLILPVLPRDEEPQSTTQESMFSFVRLSDGGPPRYAGPRSEVAVLTALARVLLGDSGTVDWRSLGSHDAIRRLIAELIPGYEPIAEIGQTRQEFHIPGRQFTENRFSTPTGKARFQAVDIPALSSLAENQLRLMTVRSEGQFNTVVYEDEDLYRGQDRRDVVLINPADIERLGLQIDQPVRVRSSTGEMRYQLVRAFAVRPGNAMMYSPEANVLVARAVDPESKTPAFKSTLVTIEPEA
jgi:molybdopterin-dependent oxidoreductase alpha subunit